MVFTSVPLYLDSPNWQQQPNHQQGSSSENPQLPSQSQPHPQASGVSPGLIRPGSMADRARMANLPQPEASLKCPRCESTNTKFCYFNNYSLSQPRHFCKTCRRYWTRGGALRSVPVGGGCRRNKRTKNNRSKSPATEENQKGRSSSTSSGPSNNITSDTISPIPAPQLPFMASLRHLTDYGAADMGFNFSGIHSAIAPASGADLDFMMGSNSGVGSSTLLPTGGAEQWRLQQFPFLTGMEQPTGGLYRFEGEGIEPPAYNTGSGHFSSKPSASLKMEENQGLNLTRQFMGNIPGNDQYWDGNAWTDLSGFTSTSNHLL